MLFLYIINIFMKIINTYYVLINIFNQLFYSFFNTLIGHSVTVELKNDLTITGKLVSVDQFLNIKLNDISVLDQQKYPHMV